MKILMRIVYCFMAMALFVTGPTLAEDLPSDPGTIRSEMMKIRRNTDWNNSKSVKEANEKIQTLTRQLEKIRLNQKAVKAGGIARPSSEAVDDPAINRATVLEHVQASAEKGKGAGIDLAKDLREQIVKTYEEDRTPVIKNPSLIQDLTILMIDFSLPQASLMIDQLENFKSIQILILMGAGGQETLLVELSTIFNKARHLPLTELYVINFQKKLSSLPDSVGLFPGLTTLALFNNHLTALPGSMDRLLSLTQLYVDANPISSILPVLKNLKSLKELSIAKTRISATEITQIIKDFPDCKVVTQ
ncbi:MAG: hypothetical protein ABIJ31_05125 [Pseudomonadota bacterium]